MTGAPRLFVPPYPKPLSCPFDINILSLPNGLQLFQAFLSLLARGPEGGKDETVDHRKGNDQGVDEGDQPIGHRQRTRGIFGKRTSHVAGQGGHGQSAVVRKAEHVDGPFRVAGEADPDHDTALRRHREFLIGIAPFQASDSWQKPR